MPDALIRDSAPRNNARQTFYALPTTEQRDGRPSRSGEANHMSVNAVCHYCGKLVYPAGSMQAKANPFCLKTRDHWYPQLHGKRADNTVIACAGCNGLKGHHPPEVLLYYLRQKRRAQSQEGMRREFSILCFDLARFGLKASIALLQSQERVSQAANDAEPAPVTMRDVCGRFTKRDLRRKL